MSEPLRDIDLRDYWVLADKMAAEQLPIYASVVRELLTEVERLKAELAAYAATPAQLVTLVRAGEAVARDAYSEDDDVCEVDASRIRFLEDALDAIGPIEEESP